MDDSQLLRLARRQAGLSQRELAAAAGLSPTTVAEVESGRRTASSATLERVLEQAGLELAAVPRVPPACQHLRRYLRLSLVERLYLAIGGTGRPQDVGGHPPWRDLWVLAAHGRVELAGELAQGVWTPCSSAEPAVRFAPWEGCRTPAVSLRLLAPLPRSGSVLVPVGFRSREVGVHPPDVVSLQCTDPAGQVALRAAARLLHEEGPVDDGFRRPPAHRDPQPRKDDHQVRHTRRYGQRRLPRETDRRGWQLDGPASLAQWLRGYGYPE